MLLWRFLMLLLDSDEIGRLKRIRSCALISILLFSKRWQRDESVICQFETISFASPEFFRWDETASPVWSNDYYLCKPLRKDHWMKFISSSRRRKYQYRLEELESNLELRHDFRLEIWIGAWCLLYHLLNTSFGLTIGFVAILVPRSNWNSVYLFFLRLGPSFFGNLVFIYALRIGYLTLNP